MFIASFHLYCRLALVLSLSTWVIVAAGWGQSLPIKTPKHVVANLEKNAALAQGVTFTELAEAAGVSGPDIGLDHGSAFADFNGDGLLDICFTQKDSRNYLFINNGNGTFAERADAARLNERIYEGIRGVTVADYDNDGDVDIYFCSRQTSALYRNNGNLNFTDVTDLAGVGGTGNGLVGTWGDYNNDGHVDLYVANWNENSHILYRNNGNGTFSNVTEDAGLGNDAWVNIGLWFDCDNDGDLDIFVSRWHDQPHRLWRNNGNGTFTNVAGPAGLSLTVKGQGAAVADYNNDGYIDIYLTNDTGPNMLFQNNGDGTFAEAAGAAGVADDGRTVDCAWGDFDNDGWTDLYVGNYGTANRLFFNNGNGTFTENSGVTADEGMAIGIALGDYNRDGFLDIYLGNSRSKNMLYRNNGNGNNWLEVDLQGTGSNRAAIGARVEVTAGGRRQIQEVGGGRGYCSQNSFILSFGLGANSVAEHLVVKWPSGLVDAYENVPANQITKLIEGQRPPGPDQTSPIISGITSTNITSSAAIITWSTDEAADSQVEYGINSNYGNSSLLDTKLIASHAVALSGLQPNTIYHYLVKSKDAAGNLATSGGFTFTTPAPSSTIFADDFNTGSLDGNKWLKGTNVRNKTLVANNALELRSQGSESGWVITRGAYMAKNTTVTVKVVQPNDDGNLGVSPTYSLPSSNGIYGQANWYRFYVYRNGHAGPYQLYVLWKKNGAENGRDVTGNLVINGVVYLRLRFDGTKIHFEASLDGTRWTDTYNETFALPGYTLDSPFYYELTGYNTQSNGVMRVDDFSIKSNASTPDTQAPQISQVAAQNITLNSAQIAWQTNELADSQVEYGLTTSYGSSSPLNTALVTAHSVSLSGLQSNSIYHYRVKSKDAAGNLAVSGDFTFTTLAVDGTPPVISNVAASNLTSSSAKLNWSTNEASDSQVEYGLTTSYGSSTPLNSSLVTSHSISLSGLQANATYHYCVKSKDAAGNFAVSGDFIFNTPASLILADDFNTGVLNTAKWRKGTNTGNQAAVIDKALNLHASAGNGWIITKNSYAARNTRSRIKVVKPNNGGGIGMSPTYTLSSRNGIYSKKNWYRFYIYRNGNSGAYRLYVQWKKNDAEGGLDVTGNLVINSAVYLRLRFDETKIHFEASLNGTVWTNAYNETFALSGYTLDSPFYYELAAYNAASNGVLTVDDFAIANNGASGAVAKLRLEETAATPIPAAFALQNYPNPFSAGGTATRIRFALPQEAEIHLAVFDLAGREVRELFAGSRSAGNHEIIWNGRNREGIELSTGSYFIRLRYRISRAGAWSQVVHRVVIVK